MGESHAPKNRNCFVLQFDDLLSLSSVVPGLAKHAFAHARQAFGLQGMGGA